MFRPTLPLALLLVAGCAARPHAPASRTDALVLRGRVIDGTGAPPLEDGVVVVEGDRITCVGTEVTCRPPEGATPVDAGGGTILPGLIDLHTHARPHYLSFFLPAGVTSIRDANNSLGTIKALQAVGPYRPRLFWSGPLLDGPTTIMRKFGAEGVRRPVGDVEDAFALEVTTPEEARAAVDLLVARGASVIKLYEQLAPEVFRAAAARARERGVRTMADLGIQSTRGLRGAQVDVLQAVEAGVGSIEHASGFSLAYQRLGGDPTRLPPDPALIDRLARAVVAGGAAVVPTLSVFYHSASETPPTLEGLPLADRVPEDMRRWFHESHAGETPEQRQRAANDLRLAQAVVQRVVALGGRVGAGSDTPAGSFNLPAGSLHQELELLVQAGLTPLQALHAATGAAGAILGREDLGVLAPGKVADLLVVEGNPARDIRETRRVRAVIQGGRVLPMDALLAQVAAPPAPPAP